MSEQIDLVLHDAECLYLAEEEEGELSILQSEIGKMTLRIREQNTALRPLLIPMDLHDVTVRTRIPEDAAFLGDLEWTSQAVQNILKNCMESVGDYGRIEIVCEDTMLFTEIRIHDNGPGFDEEELHSLFERFYRGKDEKTSGYGIGLALCRSIITRQGGTVIAKNHSEGGAVFFVRFPG